MNRALKSGPWGGSRQGRAARTVDPEVMRRALLDAHAGYSEGTLSGSSKTQNGSRTGKYLPLDAKVSVILLCAM